MHVTSLENMRRCRERYAGPSFRAALGRPPRVLDVGAMDVNGSYRALFPDAAAYVGVDLEPGPGVDRVLEAPDRLPFEDGAFDVVVSGQMLEHCPYFWTVFAEMVRVMAPAGRLFLIAPSAGPIHRYPVDCYRFHPDAWRALAQLAGLRLLEVWLDDRGPWRDLTGVFAHRESVPVDPPPPPVPAPAVPPASPEEEASAGARPAAEVTEEIARRLAPTAWLSLSEARVSVRDLSPEAPAGEGAVGVGPPVARERSVDMEPLRFLREEGDTLPGPADLAIVDGAFLAEDAFGLIVELEARMARHGLLVLAGTLPNHPAQADRQRRTRLWPADLWKLPGLLARVRPDLVVVELDVAPAGLMLVGALDPSNGRLRERYNPLARRLAEQPGPPDEERLARAGALSPDPERIEAVLSVLRHARASGARTGRVRQALRRILPR